MSKPKQGIKRRRAEAKNFHAFQNRSFLLVLGSTLILVSVGMVMVYSSSSIFALEKFGDPHYFLKRQVSFVALGICVMLLTMRVRYQVLKKIMPWLVGSTILLLVLVLFPGIGVEVGGARRWLSLKIFNFQPSELAKLVLIGYVAMLMSKKSAGARELSKDLLPPLIVTGIICALIMAQPDFGAVVTLGSVIFLLLYVGGAKWSYLLSLVLAALPAFYFLIASSPYRKRRFLSFLDPWKDPSDSGFQIIQSFLAFGNGGIFGQGIGEGKQKLFYLPEAPTDFIFSVLGEELGVVGCLFVILLFLTLIVVGVKVAWEAKEPFGSYLALGITVSLGLQAMINLGVATGLLPPKGLTLPFISYGGTSLIISLGSVGILMNIILQEAHISPRRRGHRR